MNTPAQHKSTNNDQIRSNSHSPSMGINLIDAAEAAAVELDWIKNSPGITAEDRRRAAEIIEGVYTACEQLRSLQTHR